eukprot:GHVS01004342.1.p1 GENE.GHVS01004342.1~~GHVS01004342.1.p1  ORF type:complete len:635 (+),score=54.39 GHVS01004342.1:181-2085(+)
MGLSGTYLGIVVCLLALMVSVEAVEISGENMLNNVWGIVLKCKRALTSKEKGQVNPFLTSAAGKPDNESMRVIHTWDSGKEGNVRFAFNLVNEEYPPNDSHKALASNAKTLYSNAAVEIKGSRLSELCPQIGLGRVYSSENVNDGLRETFIRGFNLDAFDSTGSTSQPPATKELSSPPPKGPVQSRPSTEQQTSGPPSQGRVQSSPSTEQQTRDPSSAQPAHPVPPRQPALAPVGSAAKAAPHTGDSARQGPKGPVQSRPSTEQQTSGPPSQGRVQSSPSTEQQTRDPSSAQPAHPVPPRQPALAPVGSAAKAAPHTGDSVVTKSGTLNNNVWGLNVLCKAPPNREVLKVFTSEVIDKLYDSGKMNAISGWTNNGKNNYYRFAFKDNSSKATDAEKLYQKNLNNRINEAAESCPKILGCGCSAGKRSDVKNINENMSDERVKSFSSDCFTVVQSEEEIMEELKMAKNKLSGPAERSSPHPAATGAPDKEKTSANLLNSVWGVHLKCSQRIESSHKGPMRKLAKKALKNYPNTDVECSWSDDGKEGYYQFYFVDKERTPRPQHRKAASQAEDIYKKLTEALNDSVHYLCTATVEDRDTAGFPKFFVNKELTDDFVKGFSDDCFDKTSICSSPPQH